MFSRIESFPPTHLVGMSKQIKLTASEITSLWKSFMPRLKEMVNRKGTSIFSVQIYDPGITFETFNLDILVTKWAAVPVTDFYQIPPEGMNNTGSTVGSMPFLITKGYRLHFLQR